MKRSRAPIFFIAPGFLVYTFFMIVPLFVAMYFSLFKWAGVGDMTFVGLANFRTIFRDPRMSKTFFNALANNAMYMAIAVCVFVPLQTLMAYLIHIRIPGARTFRLLMFLPYVISSSIIGFFSLLVFDPNIGLLNKLLTGVGLGAFVSAWFGDASKAFPLLVSIIGWQGIGVGMVIILANMKSIPAEVIEASVIDGAGGWVRFWRVELSFLRPSLINVIVLSSIFALTQFDLPFIVGGGDGRHRRADGLPEPRLLPPHLRRGVPRRDQHRFRGVDQRRALRRHPRDLPRAEPRPEEAAAAGGGRVRG